MYVEVAWTLVSSGTQLQPQVTLDPDYLQDYLSVSYDCDKTIGWYYNQNKELKVRKAMYSLKKLIRFYWVLIIIREHDHLIQ